ncbi:Ogg1 [Nucleospora cyclopteri]
MIIPMEWLHLNAGELIDIRETLQSGQVFHFKEVEKDEFAGFVGDNLLIFKQVKEKLFYRVDCNKKAVEKFLNIGINPDLQYKKEGLRFITNDLISTIFSFICSQNNNIKRITKMVSFLYSLGPVTIYKGKEIHKFPSLDKLVGVEENLKINRFGYQANYVTEAAKFINSNKSLFIEENLSINYHNTLELLLKVKGIGRKVADCICLISLRFFHIVPIDVHVFKYSCSIFNISEKKLNKKLYGQIQQKWEVKYGKYAGIAQLYIFKLSVDKKIINN